MQDIAIKVDQIIKEFPGVKALKNISFEVKKGGVHGFLGENGAGKSTTIKILSGLLSQDCGQVKICDSSDYLKDSSPRIGVLPEYAPLYLNMVVEDFLLYVAKIRNVQSAKAKEKINWLCDRLGIESVRKRMIGNLSKGYKQRIAIASALVHDPEVVILDEPTVGLDPNSIIEIREFLYELGKEKTIFLSSHQLSEVEKLCDHVTIIHQGEIVTSGGIEDILGQIVESSCVHVIFDRWNSNDKSKFKKISSRFEVKEIDKKFSVECYGVTAENIPTIVDWAIRRKIKIYEIREIKMNLEQIFQALTKKVES